MEKSKINTDADDAVAALGAPAGVAASVFTASFAMVSAEMETVATVPEPASVLNSCQFHFNLVQLV